MALISVKNLVYNKLARQNIFFALLIQFWFLLFWLTVIIIYILILILIIITIDFIVLLLLLYFIFVTVIIIILSIINVIYFVLRVTCMGLFLAIIIYIIIVIITTILFFSTLPVIGGEFSNWIRAAWSTPTHWLLWVSRRVSIIFIFILFYFFCKLFFGDHRWGVDALFHIYHMASFNYDAKGTRDVGLSCRCHLSNSQIVSSV